MDKFPIGDVVFAEPTLQRVAGFRGILHLGEKRKQLLRLAREGETLPDGLFLIAKRSGEGWCRITAAEVDWSGSGLT